MSPTLVGNVVTTVYITYRGDAGTRFDRRYYRTHHLPLVMKCWEQYGLQSVTAFYPDDDRADTIAICLCEFRDDAAIAASFGSPEAQQVMVDIEQFTNVKPAQSRSVPLSS